jgi:crotonobetainyl-CoA:carnitine CoA-transferase CaiB-like acyl-CoA transferase
MTDQHSLSGICVLDFSRVLAGPFCTMTLGDLGADVIKVENPLTGDETRAWGPPYTHTEPALSAYFCSINRNKRSITLDLKSPTDQAIAKKIAKHAHIVVENFKVGQMKSFGLDYDTLRQINPALVYCSITGFGQTGLLKDHPGYDYMIQAMTGLMAITGEVDRPPSKVGVAVADIFTGSFATNAILGALRHAERTGEGQYIDMALFDSQIVALVNVASNVLISGQDAPRYGNEHPNIVPYQSFKARDQSFVITVGNDQQFQKLCDLLKVPELALDQNYATNPARVNNRQQLTAILSQHFLHNTAEYWVKQCLSVGIPAGEINTVKGALDHPHTQSRDLIQQVELHNRLIELVSSPLRMSQTPATIRYPPPLLGQHNDEIMQWLDEQA